MEIITTNIIYFISTSYKHFALIDIEQDTAFLIVDLQKFGWIFQKLFVNDEIKINACLRELLFTNQLPILSKIRFMASL